MWGMSSRLTALMLVIAGCSASGTPATVPPSTPATSSTVAATTTAPPTTTTTTHATTTTVDRLAEIEAIFQDLEERRLQALYEGDEETFKSLFANKEYMQRSLVLFDLVEFIDGWTYPDVSVLEVLADLPACIAAVTEADQSIVSPAGGVATGIEVIEMTNGTWGISYSGEGWACEGPHPFSP